MSDDILQKIIFIAECQHDFEGQNEKEMSFKEGERIGIIENVGKWWFAVSLKAERTGLVPSNFLTKVDKQQSPETKKKKGRSVYSQIGFLAEEVENEVNHKNLLELREKNEDLINQCILLQKENEGKDEIIKRQQEEIEEMKIHHKVLENTVERLRILEYKHTFPGWDNSSFSQWLKEIEFSDSIVEAWKSSHIDGKEAICKLNNEQLKEMGISSFGSRNQLLKVINIVSDISASHRSTNLEKNAMIESMETEMIKKTKEIVRLKEKLASVKAMLLSHTKQ